MLVFSNSRKETTKSGCYFCLLNRIEYFEQQVNSIKTNVSKGKKSKVRQNICVYFVYLLTLLYIIYIHYIFIQYIYSIYIVCIYIYIYIVYLCSYAIITTVQCRTFHHPKKKSFTVNPHLISQPLGNTNLPSPSMQLPLLMAIIQYVAF